jgi:hypothetical protein
MATHNQLLICAAFAALLAITTSSSSGQQLTGSPAEPQYKYSTPLPPGIAWPNTVETRLGTLKFFDGFPDKASTQCLHLRMKNASKKQNKVQRTTGRADARIDESAPRG